MTVRLLMVLLLATAAGAEATPASWRTALLVQEPGTEVRIRLVDGFMLQGWVLDVSADSVVVAASPDGPRRGACSLDAIVSLERRGAASGRGWHVGSLVGAVAGAGYGALMAAVIESLGEGTEPLTAADAAALTLAGGTAGAVGGGLVGALATIGRERWYGIDPRTAGPRRGPGFGLHAGLATAGSGAGQDHDGLSLGLELAWLRSRWFSVGTEATYAGTGRTIGLGGGPVIEVGATGSVGLVARLSPPLEKLAPVVSIGTGWYRREDSWLGANVGIGLRWRTAGGAEIPLELRWHWRSSGLDPEPSNSQITVTAGWVIPMSFR